MSTLIPEPRLAVESQTMKFSSNESDEKKERLAGWLRDDNWVVSEQEEPGAAWVLVGRKNSVPLLVWEANSLDRLILRYEINIDRNDHSKLLRLSQVQQEDFALELHKCLASSDVQSTADAPIPRRIMLTSVIFYDAPLTRHLFDRSVVALNSTHQLIAIIFKKALGVLLRPPASLASPN